MSELNKWFRDFIQKFRDQAQTLTEKQRSKISNLDDFFPPCQILSIEYIGLPYQWILVTHDPNKPDLEIETLQMETWEAIEKIKPLVESPKWERVLTQEELTRAWNVKNYSELVEEFFIGVIGSLGNILYLKPPEPGAKAKIMFFGRDFKWITNRLEMTNLDDLVAKIIDEAKKIAKEEQDKVVQSGDSTVKETHIETEKVEDEITGFGTYFYPPIWIGEYPDYSFNEKIHGRLIWPEKSFDVKYKGKLLVVYNNGYVGLAEKTREIAYSNLNEIMATGLLLGIPFFAVYNYELSEVSFNPNILDFKLRGMRPRGSLARAFDLKNSFLEQTVRPYISIKKEGIIKICEVAEEISSEEDVSTCLTLLIEAYTCFQYSQYIQSYVLSWTIIEKNLSYLWENSLIKNKIGKKRIQKLTGTEWAISQIIEVLNLSKIITNENYKLLNILRKKRNNLVHEGESVRQEDALQCLNFAHNLILERTQIRELIKRQNFDEFILNIFNINKF